MNKVYLISKCALKPANKKFSSLSHDFEMSFTRETVIVPCEEEDESIPAISYNFIPLNKIPEKEPNTIVGKHCNQFIHPVRNLSIFYVSL